MSGTLEHLIATLSAEKRAALANMLRPAHDPIAIVGIGCRFPGGADSPAEFWRLLQHGEDAGEQQRGRMQAEAGCCDTDEEDLGEFDALGDESLVEAVGELARQA